MMSMKNSHLRGKLAKLPDGQSGEIVDVIKDGNDFNSQIRVVVRTFDGQEINIARDKVEVGP